MQTWEIPIVDGQFLLPSCPEVSPRTGFWRVVHFDAFGQASYVLLGAVEAFASQMWKDV